MKKRVALVGLLVVLCLGLWAVAGFDQKAEAACSGLCSDCLGFRCEGLLFGKCECSDWENGPGSRGCTAGGGNCIPWM